MVTTNNHLHELFILEVRDLYLWDWKVHTWGCVHSTLPELIVTGSYLLALEHWMLLLLPELIQKVKLPHGPCLCVLTTTDTRMTIASPFPSEKLKPQSHMYMHTNTKCYSLYPYDFATLFFLTFPLFCHNFLSWKCHHHFLLFSFTHFNSPLMSSTQFK